jgi:hypothetical protein
LNLSTQNDNIKQTLKQKISASAMIKQLSPVKEAEITVPSLQKPKDIIFVCLPF